MSPASLCYDLSLARCLVCQEGRQDRLLGGSGHLDGERPLCYCSHKGMLVLLLISHLSDDSVLGSM